MANDDTKKANDAEKISGVTRREFIKYSAGTAAALSLGLYGCGYNSENNSVSAFPPNTEPVLFVHISDSHFGGETDLGESQDPAMLKTISKELMSALVKDIVPVVQPLATIHTGDIVNEGFQLKPWQSYAEVLANTTKTYPMTYPKNYIEIPGNHDVKVYLGDLPKLGRDEGDGRQLFTQHSVIGQALGNNANNSDKYGITELSSPSGMVRLVRTNTSEYSEGSSPADDNTHNITGFFSEAQHQALIQDLSLSQPAMLSVVLGHHPIAAPPGSPELFTNNELMKDIVAKAGAPIYLCGHVHVPAIMWYGKTIVIQADTFGRHDEPSSFYLVAYDRDVVAVKLVAINATPPFVFDWPLVFITSPANSLLGNTNSSLGNVNDGIVHPYTNTYKKGNPNATHFTPDAPPTLRAMVFAPSTVTSVKYYVDQVAVGTPLRNTVRRVWESSHPVQGLTSGTHTVTVIATLSDGTTTGSDSISIIVE